MGPGVTHYTDGQPWARAQLGLATSGLDMKGCLPRTQVLGIRLATDRLLRDVLPVHLKYRPFGQLQVAYLYEGIADLA